MKIKQLLVGLSALTSFATTNALAEESFRLKRGAPPDSPPVSASPSDSNSDSAPSTAPNYQQGRVQADDASASVNQGANGSPRAARAPLSAGVERDAYNTGIDTNQFASQTASSAPLQANADAGQRAPLSAGVTKFDLNAQELQKIARNDVVLIIDRSSSMESMDCPSSHGGGLIGGGSHLAAGLLGFGMGLGMGTPGGISRWQWCSEQLTDLARQTSSVLPQGLSVVLFSANTKIFSHVSVSEVPRIFTQYHPGGWTNTGMALGQTLEDYFQRREATHGNVKPLLVAIITDGEPSDKDSLCRVIVEATKMMRSPDEIKVSMLIVGNDRDGEMFSEFLDHGTDRIGAKYHIVTHVPFTELRTHGLARTLLEVANGQRQ